MTTSLEQIKERIEKLEINPAYKAYAGYYNMALSDIQAILPSIIQEVVDSVITLVKTNKDPFMVPATEKRFIEALASLKEESNNV